MTMDPTAFHVVYVDHRAKLDRVECRGSSSFRLSLQPTETNRTSDDDNEHDGLQQNLEALLSAFSTVSVCTSAQSCIQHLSGIDRSDPSPVLVLLDIPSRPCPDEETSVHDGRHDSGIAAGPADIIGLPLLKFICVEMEHKRMSNSILPVALLTPVKGRGNPTIGSDEHSSEARTLQCLDDGALDVLKCPLSRDSVKALYLHCYRARKIVNKLRKRSWVGIDEPKRDDYSYLREKMVRELMTEVIKPGTPKRLPNGTQIKVAPLRAELIQKVVGQWDFSAHLFSGDELVYCAKVIFEHAFQMPEVSKFVLPPDALFDFLIACRGSYNVQIPYHNFRHVVDVLQAVFYFLLQLGALPPYGDGPEELPSYTQSLSPLITPVDALTLLVVAVGHDVGHPGVNNAFLVTLKAPLAQVYNDKSVLESFHCAAFSQVLRKHWPQTLVMRKVMIDTILATDMGLHFDYMGRLEKLRKKYDRDGGSSKWDEKTTSEHRNLLCALLIKCADISNVARKHECSAQWATILIEEFARQAHMEHDLGIPSSLVAPPVTGSVVALAKSQVGFMNLFAIPLFENLSKVLPEMGFSVKELTANKDAWSTKIDAYSAHPEESAENPANGSGRHHDNPQPERSLLAVPPGRTSPGGTPSIASIMSRRNLPPVLGTALMDSDMPPSDANTSVSGSGFASPRSQDSLALQHSGNGSATAVTLVVTHPKRPSAETNGYESLHAKRPTYQYSTEHLRAGTPSEASSSNDRPRSSPPDLGDCSDQSCTKDCCTKTVVATQTVERRSSRFFKKVRLWKTWRKESTEG